MILWLRVGEGASLRLGVVTSKKVHLRANKRNFVRRRMREAYRNLRPFFSGDFDVVLVGRRSMLDAEWKDVLVELVTLATKAGLIDQPHLDEARKTYGLK